MPSSKPTGNMKRKLRDAEIEWPHQKGSFFIPLNKLDAIMQLADIMEELRQFSNMSEAELESTAKRTFTTAKGLFAILVCGDQQDVFLNLLNNDKITDNDLPFTRIEDQEMAGEYRHKFKLAKRDHSQCKHQDHSGCGIRALENWDTHEMTDLCRNQWLVLSPVFKTERPNEIPHLELSSHCLLPFIRDGKKNSRQGGYSDVWQVQIHPAHHNLSGSKSLKDPFFAVKRLHSTDATLFQNERGMLSALTYRNHPHLIKLLSTWKQEGQYYMLFPYAEANLQSFWAKKPVPPWNSKTWLWAITQMRGLAWGLRDIHNFVIDHPAQPDIVNPQITCRRPRITGPLQAEIKEERYGRHGDLKPENILFFQDPESIDQLGTLQIADFGLSRFHRQESRSKVDPNVPGSPTYSPPETYLGQYVSRAYDIWSMGCVYLEFITWLLKGSDGVQQFADARMEKALDGIVEDVFYTQLLEQDVKGAKVRKGVELWLDHLCRNPACSEMIRDLITLVKTRMLLISKADRISAIDLDNFLNETLQRAERDYDYLLGGRTPIMTKASPVKSNGVGTQMA